MEHRALDAQAFVTGTTDVKGQVQIVVGPEDKWMYPVLSVDTRSRGGWRGNSRRKYCRRNVTLAKELK